MSFCDVGGVIWVLWRLEVVFFGGGFCVLMHVVDFGAKVDVLFGVPFVMVVTSVMFLCFVEVVCVNL